MTMIYLRHPDHGEKVAYLQAEAEADKKNGWVEFDPNKPEKQTRPRKVQDAEKTE